MRRSSTTCAAGRRGSRAVHAERLLTAITGAEAAVVVNNNAAAVLLALAALAHGREVVVSRGELVEIGGGFRVPDVLMQSGASLREVGTTNRTRLADYTAATGPATALWLRVHPSNFRIEGFTERPALAPLVAAAHAAGVAVVEDLGSGNVDPGLDWEPTVQDSVAAGVDVVCVSGDKLLGGPQAGLIIGRRRAGRSAAPPPADARAAGRQADLRGARSDAGRALDRARRRDGAGAADAARAARAAAGPGRGARGDAGGARLAGVGDRRRIGGGRRQRPWRRPAERAGAAGPAGLERGAARRLAACPGDANRRPHPRRSRRPGSARGGRRPGRADRLDAWRYRSGADATAAGAADRDALARIHCGRYAIARARSDAPLVCRPRWRRRGPGQRTSSAFSRASRWERRAPCVLAALAVVFATVNLSRYPAISGWDEGMYLEMAVNTARFGEYATRNGEAFERLQPPGGTGPTLILPVAAAMLVGGFELWVARLVIVAALLVALAGGYRLLRTIGGSFAAVTGTLLLLVAGFPDFDTLGLGRQVLAEVPALAFLLWGLWFWIRSWDGRTRDLVIASALISLAIVTKNQWLIFVTPGLAVVTVVGRLYHGALSWRHGAWPIAATVGTYLGWTAAVLPDRRGSVAALQRGAAPADRIHVPQRRPPPERRVPEALLPQRAVAAGGAGADGDSSRRPGPFGARRQGQRAAAAAGGGRADRSGVRTAVAALPVSGAGARGVGQRRLARGAGPAAGAPPRQPADRRRRQPRRRRAGRRASPRLPRVAPADRRRRQRRAAGPPPRHRGAGRGDGRELGVGARLPGRAALPSAAGAALRRHGQSGLQPAASPGARAATAAADAGYLVVGPFAAQTRAFERDLQAREHREIAVEGPYRLYALAPVAAPRSGR